MVACYSLQTHLAFKGLTHNLQDIRIRSELDHTSTRPVPTDESEALRKTQINKSTSLKAF